uniref:Putative chemosensory protein CSP8 n=2 Tax=Solenopsis invicta TaxID=13686 RepID=B7TVH6_SOLIN|nr:putative chemosensory protein CSP8 [Solenopsis invicta]
MCILAEELQPYPSEYDIYVPKILANDVVRQKAVDCYLKKGPCTEQEKLATDLFRDALKTNCKKCGEKQKEHVKILTEWFVKNQPDTWKLIIENVDS